MKTVEEKLNKLEMAIKDEIMKSRSEELESYEEEQEREYEKYKEKINRRIKNTLDEYKSKRDILREKNDNLVHSEGEEIIKNTKDLIREDLNKSLKKKLVEKYQGSAGEDYIRKAIETLGRSLKEDYHIYLFDKTFERDKKIIREYFPDIRLTRSDDIKIGGFLIKNQEETYQINFTLDYLLEKNKDKVYLESKKILKF